METILQVDGIAGDVSVETCKKTKKTMLSVCVCVCVCVCLNVSPRISFRLMISTS